MESLKGWINGFGKPKTRMIQQQTAHLHAIDPKRQLPHPVPPGLQPIKRPVLRGLSNVSLKTSFPIHERGNVIPAKRTVDQDGYQDDVQVKRPKLEEVSLLQGARSAEKRAVCAEDQRPSEQPKRPRADSVDNEPTSVKRARIGNDALEPAETDEQDQIRAGVLSGVREPVSPTVNNDAVDNFLNIAYDEVATVVLPESQSDECQAPCTNPSELGSLVRELKSKSSISLRSRARLYVTSREDAHRHTNKGMFGVGSWSGSSSIPGARKGSDNKPDGIVLPAKKPQRVAQIDIAGIENRQGGSSGQTASAMLIQVAKPPNAPKSLTATSRRSPKPLEKRISGKQQMRLSRPCWRSHRFDWAD